ncbi:hypothetical protein [Gottfriedia acidiceleris]|uniref:hypothetical protein n=1 Tax=Gottfriedia acidiceleris TaxID=371036 RepID=UPI002FFE3E67
MGNRLVTYIEFEQLDYLDQCLSWFKESDYFYIALSLIIEGFIKVGRLEEAHQLLNHSQNLFNDFPTTNEPRRIELYFHYAHALYHCAQNEYEEGLQELLDVASKASELGKIKRFKHCLQIFWKSKNHTTNEIENKFMELLA